MVDHKHRLYRLNIRAWFRPLILSGATAQIVCKKVKRVAHKSALIGLPFEFVVLRTRLKLIFVNDYMQLIPLPWGPKHNTVSCRMLQRIRLKLQPLCVIPITTNIAKSKTGWRYILPCMSNATMVFLLWKMTSVYAAFYSSIGTLQTSSFSSTGHRAGDHTINNIEHPGKGICCALGFLCCGVAINIT